MERIGTALIDLYVWGLYLVAAFVYAGHPDEGAEWLEKKIRQIVEFGEKHGDAETDRR